MHKTFVCLPVLAVALLAAGCGGGASAQQKQDFSHMNARQRDKVGYKAAANLRRTELKEDADTRVTNIRYRASDDTLVYTLMLKKISSPEVFNAVQRRKLDVTLHKEGRKEVCRNRNMRDLMIHGRYSVEYRVLARNGKALSSPIRISAKDC